MLGNIFLWSGTAFYPYYTHGDAIWHISPIADQNLAGAIMMVEESILTLGLLCWLFLRAARESEERQDLLDFAGAHGLELTDARARARGRCGAERRRSGRQAVWRVRSAAGDGGEDRDFSAVGDGGLQTIQEADVLAADVHVDEASQ